MNSKQLDLQNLSKINLLQNYQILEEIICFTQLEAGMNLPLWHLYVGCPLAGPQSSRQFQATVNN